MTKSFRATSSIKLATIAPVLLAMCTGTVLAQSAKPATGPVGRSLMRVDANALFRASASLRQSQDDVQQRFGWAAASVAVKQITLQSVAACKVEQEALQAHNTAAFAFLASLYETRPGLASLRLGQTPTKAPDSCSLSPTDAPAAAYVAMLRDAVLPIQSSLPGEVGEVLKVASDPSSLPKYIDSPAYQLLGIAARSILAIVAAKHPVGILPLSTVAALRDCAAGHAGDTDPLDTFLMKSCSLASGKLGDIARLPARVRDAHNERIDGPWQRGATDILRIGDDLQLYGEAANLAGSCPASGFNKNWNGRVSVPVQSPGILTGSTARILPDGHTEGGGAIFEPIILGRTEADTPSTNILAYGVRQRTWGQSGRLHFGMTITYRPTIGAIALAVRFRRVSFSDNPNACAGLELVQAKCISGCLNAGLIEPGTTWEVLPITGDEVTLELAFDGCADYFTPCAGTRSGLFIGSKIFEETLQILEIGSSRHNDFGYTDPLVITEVNKDRPVNPLISYVAALAQDSRPGGWLIPENNKSEMGAAQSEVRLAILRRLADRSDSDLEDVMQPELKDRSTEAYIRTSWKERHDSISVLWNSIVFRRDFYYRIPLAAGIAAGSVSLSDLREASKQLGVALSSLNQGRIKDIREILISSQTSLGLGKNPIASSNRETLETAVIGASASVDSALEELLVSQNERCRLWSGLRWDSLPDDELRRATDTLCRQ